MELLLAAGYFRVRIKGLSEFDKVINFSLSPTLDSSFAGGRWTCLEHSSLQFHCGYRRSLSRKCHTRSKTVCHVLR